MLLIGPRLVTEHPKGISKRILMDLETAAGRSSLGTYSLAAGGCSLGLGDPSGFSLIAKPGG